MKNHLTLNSLSILIYCKKIHINFAGIKKLGIL